MAQRTESLRRPNPLLQPPRTAQAPRASSEASFRAELDEQPSGRSSGRRRALPRVASAIASAIPGGAGAAVRALTPGSGSEAEGVDAMWEMQREQQEFNLEYLALQQSIQSENREFSTLSNLLKAQHDTAKAAVSNIRV